ncbi:hypothetical protein SKAU_G00297600 [Synaphobranchus kaupii]|uniref:Uncharacterized protein n=1 Tax=Synaphobranchus kaupii TaxID=118154 RepID=A0A9Q1ILZ6_SYNKA|nr:hypothetical protein SKAU_G00297600 [Synaphobranchus kaupii]
MDGWRVKRGEPVKWSLIAGRRTVLHTLLVLTAVRPLIGSGSMAERPLLAALPLHTAALSVPTTSHAPCTSEATCARLDGVRNDAAFRARDIRARMGNVATTDCVPTRHFLSQPPPAFRQRFAREKEKIATSPPIGPSSLGGAPLGREPKDIVCLSMNLVAPRPPCVDSAVRSAVPRDCRNFPGNVNESFARRRNRSYAPVVKPRGYTR